MIQEHGWFLCIGKWDPPHRKHLELWRRGWELCSRGIILVGSSFRARSTRVALTFSERRAMIEDILAAEGLDNVTILPIRDYFDNDRWVREVRKRAADVTGDGAKITMVGCEKDATSRYLRWFPGFSFDEVPLTEGINATDVRRAWLRGKLDEVAHLVHPVVVAHLERLAGTAMYDQLRDELDYVTRYPDRWEGHTFITADAVVSWNDEVLFITRAGLPGKGLLALPGGYLGRNETLQQCVINKLREETHLQLSPEQIVEWDVFDNPWRADHARIVTHGFHFLLPGDEGRPDVTAGRGADTAGWIPLGDLSRRSEEIYGDHLHLVERFRGEIDFS